MTATAAFRDAEWAYGISAVCRALGISRSGVHAQRTRMRCHRKREDDELRPIILRAHKASRRTYGSPRIHQALHAQGHRIGKKRVCRLMREEGLSARIARRFVVTTDSRHEHPIADNTLDRDFSTGPINKRWAGDITYIRTNEGWLFLAVLLDVGSRRVVGFSMGASMHTELCTEALSVAIGLRRPGPGVVHHTDRGSQYASGDYGDELKAHAIVASMSRKGNCWDNAISESFFATLKKELVYRTTFESRSEATRAIADYIDYFYNTTRLHSTLGYLSPHEFEQRQLRQQQAA